MQNGRIYRKGSAWILSYAVKAQEPDGKITWARRSKRPATYTEQKRPSVMRTGAANVNHIEAYCAA
jgi:hypothetical protein